MNKELKDLIYYYVPVRQHADMVIRQGWTRVESGLPEDSESVWFYCPKYNAVGAGKFYKQDNFKRENIFISNDGGHYLLDDVSHYMINKKPLPPE